MFLHVTSLDVVHGGQRGGLLFGGALGARGGLVTAAAAGVAGGGGGGAGGAGLQLLAQAAGLLLQARLDLTAALGPAHKQASFL